MNKYICPGTYVVSKDGTKKGQVITFDRNIAVVLDDCNNYWTSDRKDLDVISYKGVK